MLSDIDDDITSDGVVERCRGTINEPRTRRNESGTQQSNGERKECRALIKLKQ